MQQKFDLKNAIGVDTSYFAKKADLTNLKSDVDKLDIDELKNAPTNLSNLESKVDKLDVGRLLPASVDLSKLSDVVQNDVVKKDVYNGEIKIIEDKRPDITNLATNTILITKINRLKSEIPCITNLTTTAALITAENEIPNVSILVKKLTIIQKLMKLKKRKNTKK